MNKTWIALLFFQLSVLSIPSKAAIMNPSDLTGFYAGVMGGFGSTTWNGLVPVPEEQNLAMSLSTPLWASEGGGAWGLFAGYELFPALAIEANFTQYPRSTIIFDEISLFSFAMDGATRFYSETKSLNLIAKILLNFSSSKIRLYSGAGIAAIHRKDILLNNWRATPAFSLGIDYPIGQRLRIALDGNYTAGYGEARLSPTETYIPFLYSAGVKLAWRF